MKLRIGKATLILFTIAIGLVMWTGAGAQEEEGLDPASIRAVARDAGLKSLAEVPIPKVENLHEFVNRGRLARSALVILGKSLFWDMQVGSDGQACATCHFHAGADSRSKNQLSPGLKNTDPNLQGIFDPTGSGGNGGPNYTLEEDDFPFHRLAEPEDRTSAVLFDTDDVTSSQGAFAADFLGIVRGDPNDVGAPFLDTVFNVEGINVRRVEPRNTPTMINAVFNFSNFWDGRAHNEFNGRSVIGPLDPEAEIWVWKPFQGLVAESVRIPNSSLASQAVGPPESNLEMSFFDRPFPLIGRKLLSLRPLGLQRVHPQDSILGFLSRARLRHGEVVGRNGLRVSYATLIKIAFRPKYWISRKKIDGFSQLEKNFSLFFGLAVQEYESTLVSDRSPFDKFMEGDDGALDDEELRGLLAFINTGEKAAGEGGTDPDIFVDNMIGAGNCISCHGGPEFTDHGFTSLAADAPDELELAEVEETPELIGGEIVVGEEEALLDNGFSNIGVRNTGEDLGRGGMEGGFPLAFVRQVFIDAELLPEDFELECLDTGDCPERDQVDGAFKVPDLRNVELTGPYFHNGGEATLEQVLEFYNRQGNFSNENIENLDRNMAFIDFERNGAVEEELEEDLIRFLLALTDERVSLEKAPFDHPQLFVPNGHPGDEMTLSFADCVAANDFQACDDLMEVPPIGRNGRLAAGLEPLETFLNLEHLDED